MLVCLWCACACPTIYRPGPPDNTGHNITAEALVGASRCKGDGPALQGARAFGGGSPVREVGTSSCWAPPPSRQPQRGPAAPYHGRLGATTRWGDKVRVEGPANGESLGNANES